MEKHPNQEPEENGTPEERFVDEKTKDRIHQHIADPNSKITEEDIRNVNTDIFKREDEDIPSIEEEISKKAPNPWDIKSE